MSTETIIVKVEAKDAFARWSNGDGTYNGLKMLADLAGVPEAQVRQIAEVVMAQRASSAKSDQTGE